MALVTATSLLTDASPVFIESAESKNIHMQSVFNHIRFIPGWKKDVWMMNQSHHGPGAPDSQRDRLAIVIDKSVISATAKFYQLSAGPLLWTEDLPTQKVEFSVSCMICHNNGPRALRPQYDSKSAPLNLRDRFKIAAWNLRIKSYGRIHYDPSHDREDEALRVPFRHRAAVATKELKVKTCVRCRQEKGWWARGALQRQQIATIESLVERGEMPPPGFSLSPEEKRELQDFIRGF